MKGVILLLYNHYFEHMVKKRAYELGMTVPQYLKYAASKEIEESELDNRNKN